MSSEAWKKENTLIFSIRIMNASGIPNALDKALESGELSRNAYIIEAIREKLIRDGYLSEETEKSE